MSDYAAKTSYDRATDGNAQSLGETRRDTARALDMLVQCHSTIGQIEESIGIARNALWGPMPSGPENSKSLKAVEPSGFLPATLASLTALLQRLEAMNASARNLRNL